MSGPPVIELAQPWVRSQAVPRIGHDFPAALDALRRRPWLVGALTVLALFAAWALVTEVGGVPALFLPSPRSVLARLGAVATDGFMDATLWQHLAASLARIVVALAAALASAIPIGIALGTRPLVRAALDPLIEFYRPIPPLAYLPLIVIWFGIGELSKVLLIYLAIFAPMAISTAAGVRNADPNRVLAARSMGATQGQVLRHVVLPSALPAIFTGVRVGLGVGWSTLVAAELIAATRGLGFMIQSAAQFLVTDVVVLGILVIAVIAFGLELLMRALQRRLVPWEGRC